jgi:hypothetical protein
VKTTRRTGRAHGRFALPHGQKVIDKMRPHPMIHLDHPPYSLHVTPCGFWLFEVLKN